MEGNVRAYAFTTFGVQPKPLIYVCSSVLKKYIQKLAFIAISMICQHLINSMKKKTIAGSNIAQKPLPIVANK